LEPAASIAEDQAHHYTNKQTNIKTLKTTKSPSPSETQWWANLKWRATTVGKSGELRQSVEVESIGSGGRSGEAGKQRPPKHFFFLLNVENYVTISSCFHTFWHWDPKFSFYEI